MKEFFDDATPVICGGIILIIMAIDVAYFFVSCAAVMQ